MPKDNSDTLSQCEADEERWLTEPVDEDDGTLTPFEEEYLSNEE